MPPKSVNHKLNVIKEKKAFTTSLLAKVAYIAMKPAEVMQNAKATGV